ncbi:hypothetical protein EV2_038543 [Malus domestica]
MFMYATLQLDKLGQLAYEGVTHNFRTLQLLDHFVSLTPFLLLDHPQALIHFIYFFRNLTSSQKVNCSAVVFSSSFSLRVCRSEMAPQHYRNSLELDAILGSLE